VVGLAGIEGAVGSTVGGVLHEASIQANNTPKVRLISRFIHILLFSYILFAGQPSANQALSPSLLDPL
jgi:hypothetical protein